MKPTHIKQLQTTSRDLRVLPLNRHKLVVESRSDPLNSHVVTVRFGNHDAVYTDCTCEWAQYNGVACAHAMAALQFLAARKGRRLSFWLSEADARRQKQRVFTLAGDDPVWITSRTG